MSAGYDRPEALVETGWLADHLGDADLCVLDASYHLPAAKRDARAEYGARHIPGARFFDIDATSDRGSPLPHMLPSPEDFAAAVGALGVGNGSMVVVYDVYGLMSAARAWWMFRVFGHDRVAVLNGGLPKWLAENRRVSDELPVVETRVFSVQYRSELVRDMNAVKAQRTADAGAVVDARAPERFAGAAEEVWPGRRRGHIPGSRNVPYTDLIDPVAKTLVPAEAIRRRFAAAGVDLDAPPVFSCGSGITACALALGAFLVGQDRGAVYDGSWAEWGLPGPNPVEP
ncbi:MAG: rhodanese-like domain-containing protein [Alphaproteobacteria bacterium]